MRRLRVRKITERTKDDQGSRKQKMVTDVALKFFKTEETTKNNKGQEDTRW